MDLTLNETPIRTAKNYAINNIKLENIEIPEVIQKFNGLKILGDVEKFEILEMSKFSEFKYGNGKILENQIKENAIRGNTKRGSTIIKLFNYHSSKKNHHNIFTNLYNNKENSSLNNAKIYLKLEKSEEIAKIVNEEEKKRYFNREFHINKNINREELKRRIELTSPSYQRTYNKKSKTLRNINSVEIKRRKNKFLSSSYNNYEIKLIKNLININNKLINNYKYQGENEILKSKMNYDAVTNFLQSMDEQKKLQYEEMEKKFLENKKKNPFINDDEKINEKEKEKNLENAEKNELT